MAEDGSKIGQWRRARLLSTAGIRGTKEQEQRATSALLAVMAAVPPFGRALLADLGAPRGRIDTYTEVPLRTAEGTRALPDGAITVERGKKHWCCLVEVKTGKTPLKEQQIIDYLDIARREGFDGVLIINNDILGGANDVPIQVPAKKLGKVRLWQLSWWRILTEAVVQHEHRGVSDPEQAWILSELIAYLMHENSGAGEFDDMGPSWTAVREGVRHNTLTKRQEEVHDIARRWEQFVHYVALGLTQELGEEVVPRRVRHPLEERIHTTINELVDAGQLSMELRVPHTVGPVGLRADLRARLVTTTVAIKASAHVTPTARIRWILRQLAEAPDDLRLEVRFERASRTTSALLGPIHEDPTALLLPDDGKRAPREFELSLSRPMGIKRGSGPGSFVTETRQQAVDFYRELVQNLVPYQPKAPRIRKTPTSGGASAGSGGTARSGIDVGRPPDRESEVQPDEWVPPPAAVRQPPDTGAEDSGVPTAKSAAAGKPGGAGL